MRILEFMFYKVYHFYNRRWPGKDAEIYAMCFVALWLYFITLFLALILFNLTAMDFLNNRQRWLIILPGLIFLTAGWNLWLSRDRYKRITNNKTFSLLEQTQKGKLYMSILLLLPCLFLVIALITKTTS